MLFRSIWDVTWAAQVDTKSLDVAASGNAHPPQILSDTSLLQNDGWLTTNDGALLFWVPPGHRERLFWPRTLAITGSPTRINFDRFVQGEQWEQCCTGN